MHRLPINRLIIRILNKNPNASAEYITNEINTRLSGLSFTERDTRARITNLRDLELVPMPTARKRNPTTKPRGFSRGKIGRMP
jgi:hypothetical protein